MTSVTSNVTVRTCVECDTVFIGSKRANYCGGKCRVAAHRRKKAEGAVMGHYFQSKHDEIAAISTRAAKHLREIRQRYGYVAAKETILAIEAIIDKGNLK